MLSLRRSPTILGIPLLDIMLRLEWNTHLELVSCTQPAGKPWVAQFVVF